MKEGVILYFKKSRKAFVAKVESGKVFLPLESRQVFDGTCMRDLQFAEPRLKPKERDPVIVDQLEERTDAEVYAKAWALHS